MDSTVDSGSLIERFLMCASCYRMDLDASRWILGEVLLDACQSVPHLKIEAWPHIPHIATAACAM